MSLRGWSVKHARFLEAPWRLFQRVLPRLRRLAEWAGPQRAERLLRPLEHLLKGLFFECRMCGQCVLSASGAPTADARPNRRWRAPGCARSSLSLGKRKRLPKAKGPLSGPFEAACRSGRFVVTAEITPPDSAAPAPASCFASPAITCARVFSSAQPRTRSLAHVPGVHIPEPLLAEIIDLASFGRDHEGKRTAVA